MATLTIRDLDPAVKTRLRVAAAENGRSMEAEARAILAEHLGDRASAGGVAAQIRAALVDTGGVELEVPPRDARPRSADLGS